MKRIFDVTGMSCAACSARVEKAVKAVRGVSEVSVNLLTGTLTLETGTAADEEIIRAVVKAGYGASLRHKSAGKTAAAAEKPAADTERRQRKRILIASFVLLLPLMYVSMGHMAGLRLPEAICREKNPASFALIQFLLALPGVILNGGYYVRGFRALWRCSPNMDSLIATGSAAALGYGVITLFMVNARVIAGDMEGAVRLAGGLYFESAVMIPALINLGKYLEFLSKGRTTDALKEMTLLAPVTAFKQTENGEIEISASDIRPGDLLNVKPGSRIPADGVIVEGGSSIDESMLTGESLPVYREAGERVNAATVNAEGFFRMRVEKAGEETTFSRIVRMVEQASAAKPPISRLADRIAGIFVPAVMGIALVTLGVHLILGREVSHAITRAISVLVVSCPCALGLATPVAVMVGTGIGAKRGILFRGGEAIETAGRIDTLVTDKTGTLTFGKPTVTRILGFGMSENELLAFAASAEKMSEHPLAGAVCSCAEQNGIALLPAEAFENVPGRGIRAVVNGRRVRVGSAGWFEGGIPDELKRGLDRAYADGETALIVETDGAISGAVCCSDAMRPGARKGVEQLRQLGVEVCLLTGDNRRTASAAAEKLKIDRVFSEVLPDQKADKVTEIKNEGKTVAMLGDGINDAPALKNAHVGMAVGGGTDVALESADILLMSCDPADAAEAVRLSRAVVRNIKQNLFWAFFYNALMIPIAAGVLEGAGVTLSPMLSALAMSLSSLFVVTNALRLNRFRFSQKENFAGEKPETYKIQKEVRPMITLKVEGMMCMHCVAHVKKAIESLPGMTAEVSLEKGEACVTGAEEKDREALIKAVTEAGYEAK